MSECVVVCVCVCRGGGGKSKEEGTTGWAGRRAHAGGDSSPGIPRHRRKLLRESAVAVAAKAQQERQEAALDPAPRPAAAAHRALDVDEHQGLEGGGGVPGALRVLRHTWSVLQAAAVKVVGGELADDGVHPVLRIGKERGCV